MEVRSQNQPLKKKTVKIQIVSKCFVAVIKSQTDRHFPLWDRKVRSPHWITAMSTSRKVDVRFTLRGKCLARNLSCLHSVYIKLEINYSKLSHTARSRKCQRLNGQHPHRTGDQRSRHGHQPMCLCDQLTFPPATGWISATCCAVCSRQPPLHFFFVPSHKQSGQNFIPKVRLCHRGVYPFVDRPATDVSTANQIKNPHPAMRSGWLPLESKPTTAGAVVVWLHSATTWTGIFISLFSFIPPPD